MGTQADFDKGLDFQFTDFGEAREVLDELPPGLAELQQREPGYWLSRRRPPSPADRALTGPTMDWLIKLPAAVQPRRTSVLHPRLVNLLAESAASPAGLLRTIDGLFEDRRGGRRGLPEPVQQELRALQEYFQGQLGAAASADEIARARRLLEAAGYRVIPPVA